ncbi:MAG: CehA/McbA family metallohydrolase, partial [Opitutaceae bacterium]|nr:CehA/McbA family metallohydrolase [Opitutaceae bacterium]
LLRYDIEVSGFGSHQSGHLCLLRLTDQMYPGGTSKNHWPTLGLNTLRWAKKQGAVCGPAHSGWGLQPAVSDEKSSASSTTSGALRLATGQLPNYVVPPFNGIGANEYIVDVTHELPGPDGKLVPAVDFISTVNTPYVWELNIWYHTLNAGFRTRISGETDFPCVYDEKVGLGRSYVKLDGKLDYDAWCEGIRLGRNYVGDGKSHLMDFKANDVAMGERGSELRLGKPGKIRLTARVAARLGEQRNEAIHQLAYDQKPYWDLERARIGTTREVPVEVVVNGIPVATRNIVADGREQDVAFEVDVAQSSWVALRILPSSHTNPVFVLVGDRPIRASRRSVEWCLQGVDQCWSQKERFIRPEEMTEAKQAYAHAREVYQQRLAECAVE